MHEHDRHAAGDVGLQEGEAGLRGALLAHEEPDDLGAPQARGLQRQGQGSGVVHLQRRRDALDHRLAPPRGGDELEHRAHLLSVQVVLEQEERRGRNVEVPEEEHLELRALDGKTDERHAQPVVANAEAQPARQVDVRRDEVAERLLGPQEARAVEPHLDRLAEQVPGPLLELHVPVVGGQGERQGAVVEVAGDAELASERVRGIVLVSREQELGREQRCREVVVSTPAPAAGLVGQLRQREREDRLVVDLGQLEELAQRPLLVAEVAVLELEHVQHGLRARARTGAVQRVARQLAVDLLVADAAGADRRAAGRDQRHDARGQSGVGGLHRRRRWRIAASGYRSCDRHTR